MPNKSEDVIKEQFNSKLEKGTLFYWKNYRFGDGTVKNKYLLVLSKNPQELSLICVLPSSSIKNFRPGGKFGPGGWRRDFYIIEENQSKHFPKATVINLTAWTEIPREKLKNAYCRGAATIVDKLEDEILEKIDEVVKDAYTLSDREKEKII